MSDPTHVTPAQLRAAYDALGLDPELFTSTLCIRLDPEEVTVTRYVLNDNDTQFLGDDGEPVTWQVDIPIADTISEMVSLMNTDMAEMLHAGLGDGQQLLAALAVEPDETHGCGDPDCHDCGTTA